MTIVACENDLITLKLKELDDMTHNEVGDDNYGSWRKNVLEWSDNAESAYDDFVFEAVDSNGRSGGRFNVKVKKTLVSKYGRFVEQPSIWDRRMLRGPNTEESVNTADRSLAAANDDSWLQDCVHAYYHIDLALEMAEVIYNAPSFIVNDISQPFLNFIGFDEVNRITLYKEENPLTIDVLPREEYSAPIVFDC